MAGLFGGSRWWRSLLGLVIVGVVGLGGLAVFDYLTAPPWAHSRSGRPPLVGYWQGVMPIEPGDNRQVVVRLARYTGRGRGTDNRSFTGAAKACGPKGVTHYDSVSGRVLNRQGTRFRFGFTAQNLRPGTYPGGMESTWDGRDLVTVNAELYTQTADGAAVSRSDDPVIRFDLHRSTEAAFDKACG